MFLAPTAAQYVIGIMLDKVSGYIARVLFANIDIDSRLCGCYCAVEKSESIDKILLIVASRLLVTWREHLLYRFYYQLILIKCN